MKDLCDIFAGLTERPGPDLRKRDRELEDAWYEAKRPPEHYERARAASQRSEAQRKAKRQTGAGTGFVTGKVFATKRAVPVTLATEPLDVD